MEGSVIPGNLPLFHGKRPASTIAPPMVVPWPQMNLVAECTTMSAPKSSGRQRYGLAKVLSTTSGMPLSCAIFATVSMSSTSIFGLPSVSAKMHLVFGPIALRIASGSPMSTKRALMPILRNCTSNWLMVPPYSVLEETNSSPASMSETSAMCCAAWPEAVATAPMPFSSAAMRSSNTATVGFMMRE